MLTKEKSPFIIFFDYNSEKSKLYTLFLVLLPILKQYKFLSLQVVNIFNIFVFACFLFNRNRWNVKNTFFPYVLFAEIFMTFALVDLSSSIFVVINNIVFYFLLMFNMFIIAPRYFDLEYGFKCYKSIVLISCVLTVIQMLVNNLMSYRLILVIPWLTLNYQDNMVGETLIKICQNTAIYRPSSFFIEPVHYAHFCLPFLFLSLFTINSKYTNKNIIISLFVTLSICISSSSLGIIGCIVAWILFLCRLFWTEKRKKLIALVPFICIVVIYIYNLDSVQGQILAKTASAENLSNSSSLTLRLIRGWLCFEQLDLFHKFFGVGYNCISAFFTEHNIKTTVDVWGMSNSYMNGITQMLCSLGIFGTLLYLIPFIKLIIQGRNGFTLLCWLLLMFTSQVFDNELYFLFMVFIIQMSQEKRNDASVFEFLNNKHFLR